MAESERPAVLFNNIADDGQPQTVPGVGFVDPGSTLAQPLQLFWGTTGSIIFHPQRQTLCLDRHGQPHGFSGPVTGVIQQVA